MVLCRKACREKHYADRHVMLPVPVLGQRWSFDCQCSSCTTYSHAPMSCQSSPAFASSHSTEQNMPQSYPPAEVAFPPGPRLGASVVAFQGSMLLRSVPLNSTGSCSNDQHIKLRFL